MNIIYNIGEMFFSTISAARKFRVMEWGSQARKIVIKPIQLPETKSLSQFLADYDLARRSGHDIPQAIEAARINYLA